MRVTVGQLRRVIREDYLKGVPVWELSEATRKYVNEVRHLVSKHILQYKSDDFVQQREAIDSLNSVLEQLEVEANQLLEDKLWEYVQNT